MLALTYASRAQTHFDEERLIDLAEQAAQRNLTLSVTGYLFYKNGRFFQYLEGAQAAVGAIFSSISADPRHHILKIVELGPIERRKFSDWSMRYISPAELEACDMDEVVDDIVSKMVEGRLSPDAMRRQVLDMVARLYSVRDHIRV